MLSSLTQSRSLEIEYIAKMAESSYILI